MKIKILLLLILAVQLPGKSQTELKNIYSTYSAMHGGMATSGVSKSMTYTFVATQKIRMSYTQFNNLALDLVKGDTLIIHLNSYTPYQSNYFGDEEFENNKIEILENYSAEKIAQHTYSLSFSLNVAIDKAITYTYKGQEFVAALKPDFDVFQEHYAP